MGSSPLTLVELLPLVFLSIGCLAVSRMVSRVGRESGGLAFAGLCLIFLGNLAKAAWILVLVALEVNARPLDNIHLVLVMPGAVCLAWAFWNAFRSAAGVPVWVVPVIVIAVGEGTAAIRALTKPGNGWFYVLLVLTAVSLLGLNVLLIRESRLRRVEIAAYLLMVALIILAFHLWLLFYSWSAGARYLSLFAASSGWAAFAYGAWRLAEEK